MVEGSLRTGSRRLRSLLAGFARLIFGNPFAHAGLGSNRRSLLAIKCRVAAQALLAVYVVSVLAIALPLGLQNPGWYLAFNSGLVNNGPIILFAFFFASLALYWDPQSRPNQELALPLTWTARLASLGFVLVVLSQLLAGFGFVQQLAAQNRNQLQALTQQQTVIAQAITATTNPNLLAALLQRLPGSPSIPSDGSAALTLPQQKQAILEGLASQRRRAESQLAQQRRQRLVRLATDSLRIAISALVLAAACRAFASANLEELP